MPTSPVAARILKPGPHSIWVDKGRRLCQDFGLCEGGAADSYAYQWVNALLRNPAGNPAIEITAGPFELEFQTAVRVALCGANCEALLSNRQLHNWSSFNVSPGDRLKLGFARSGLRSYLGFMGSVELSSHFGSCQQLQSDGSHKLLATGETFRLQPANQSPPLNTMVPWWLIPNYDELLHLHLFCGYQFAQFEPRQIAQFFNSEYTVTASSNRMGYRLAGEAVKWQKEGIVSQGIAYGSVQITPDGNPIVLLNDRQTIGGYPKLGCVAQADCARLAQCRPGQRVKFERSFLADISKHAL